MQLSDIRRMYGESFFLSITLRCGWFFFRVIFNFIFLFFHFGCGLFFFIEIFYAGGVLEIYVHISLICIRMSTVKQSREMSCDNEICDDIVLLNKYIKP